MKRIASLLLLPLLLFVTTALGTPPAQERPAQWAQPVAAAGVENLYRIDEKLYRSAQPDAAGFAALTRLGIRSVLNLRNFHSDDDEAAGLGLTLRRVEMEAGEISVPQLVSALRIIREADGPVLVHCWHGSDRTGAVSAAYRIIMQGWSREAAVDELINGGYGYHSLYGNIPALLRQLDVAAVKAAVFAPAAPGTSGPATTLRAELSGFRPLAEEALALRAETIKVGRRILAEQQAGKPLRGADFALLNEGLKRHLALRGRLLKIAEAHAGWLDADAAELQGAGVTPELRREGVALSLAAALVLYDNYLLAVSLFEGDAKLRRLLNENDPAYAIRSDELDKVTLDYNSPGSRERVRRAIRYYEKEARALERTARTDPDIDYVVTLIAQSPSFSMVKRWSPLYVVSRQLGFLGAATSDTLAGLERRGVNLFSMVFGNAVGLVETRKGKLMRRAGLVEQLRAGLRAGDILLEKTPFRLTDKLIPGYWGHAAVWVGSERELKELGIWDDPVLVPYQEAIRGGRQVVEALRSGVEINPLEQFMNIDSLGVMRRPAADDAERARVVLQSLRQIGKPYDFNFEVESKAGVYCSKLVYLAYGDLAWPTHRSLGRTTFTPDDVAARALDGSELELVVFFHDGQKVTERPREVMAQLMGLAREQ